MRLMPALAASAALLLGACQNPDGSTNVPATLALGAGAAIAGAALISANNHNHRPPPRYDYYRRPAYGYGYGRPAYGYGYGGPYRRW